MDNIKSWEYFKNIGGIEALNNSLKTCDWTLVSEYDENGNLKEVYPVMVSPNKC